MPALNFQPRFADLVASGKKRQTIRAVRRRPIKPGDLLHLFTGMRTNHCKRLPSAQCRFVMPIRIEESGFMLTTGAGTQEQWKEPMLLRWFAVRDGFHNWAEMWEWFNKVHGLPFEGVLIAW